MEICIFDMDGVLIKSGGYHKALKDTVKLIGEKIGFVNVILTDEQIAKFEALGISSEWHSSAFCKAIMLLQQSVMQRDGTELYKSGGYLDLEDLFEAVEAQPLQAAPLDRGLVAVEKIAQKYDVSADKALKVLDDSHTVANSEAISTFEELVLGSTRFREVYDQEPQFSIESYLLDYDEKLIEDEIVKGVFQWLEDPVHVSAVMTNRPSKGPGNFRKSPDSELGLKKIGFESLPMIGYGEISWLADRSGKRTEEIGKPRRAHALAAILAASGWSAEKSLEYSIKELADLKDGELDHLDGSRITVFEDTPAGIVAVKKTAEFLNAIGLNIKTMKYGIADDTAKEQALSAQGAEVYPNINKALSRLIFD